MKMNSKMMAVVMSIVVVLSCTSVVSLMDADADTDETANVNVYYYTSATDYCKTSVYAYDLYQAVVTASGSLGFSIETATIVEEDYYGYTVTYEGHSWNAWHDATTIGDPESYSYWDVNPYYGTLSKINGCDIDSYSIYVYTSEGWEIADPAIGWYRPFQDYADTAVFEDGDSAGAANILIVPYGTTFTYPTDTMGFTQIGTTSEYRYTFYIQNIAEGVSVPIPDNGISVTTVVGGTDYDDVIYASDIDEGVTIVGYGSDAYLALLNALGSDYFDGQDVRSDDSDDYTTYYSWMKSLLGLETVYTTYDDTVDGVYGYWSEYYYWASYTSDGTYLDYTLGYYSGLSGAANAGTSFKITYELSSMFFPYPDDSDSTNRAEESRVDTRPHPMNQRLEPYAGREVRP